MPVMWGDGNLTIRLPGPHQGKSRRHCFVFHPQRTTTSSPNHPLPGTTPSHHHHTPHRLCQHVQQAQDSRHPGIASRGPARREADVDTVPVVDCQLPRQHWLPHRALVHHQRHLSHRVLGLLGKLQSHACIDSRLNILRCLSRFNRARRLRREPSGSSNGSSPPFADNTRPETNPYQN
jgi:hypothetical protein